MANFGEYQDEIYLADLSGKLPKLPVDFATLEKRAHAAMPPSLVSYVAGGCGDEHTQRANVTAFEHWGIIPRMLAARQVRDLSIRLVGMDLPTPIFMAPIGVLGLCAQDGHGDLAAARAAERSKIPMIASTLTVDPLEVIAKEFGGTPGFSSSIRRTIERSPKVLYTGPKRLGSRALLLRWTPGSRDGGRGI